ncbi:MAG: Rne/Rng family ribonuclease, partial [Pseudomonadota bacterium]
MAKKMLIDATHPEETRVVVVDGNKVDDFDFESVNKKQLAGNIYLAKVTRVEPSLQAAFVDYGGNRHGFLSFAEIHPDYYQIPVADREALIAEEAALVRRENGNGGGSQNGSQDEDEGRRGRGRRGRRKSDRQGGEEQAVAEDLDADGAVEAEAASDGGDEGRAEGGKGRSRGRRGRGRRKSGDSASDDGGIAGFDVIDPEGGGLDGAPEPQEVAAAPSEPASEVSPDEGPEAVDEATTESAAEGSVTAAVAEVPASEEPSEEAAPEHESPLETVPDGEGADADAELEPPVATAEPETPEGIVAEPEAGAAEEVDPEPPVGPRSMAESAGLDDEDDVVRGDVPASDAASSDAPAAEDGAETGSDAEVEKPKPKRRAPRRKPAPKTEGASEAPAEEGAAAAEKPAEKPRRRRRKAEPEEAAASAETPIVETPTPETSAAASESAEDAPTPENPAVDVVSAEATAETITAEAPTDTEDATAAGEAPLGEAAEASEDTAASAADADETILADREAPTPEDPSEGGSPAKPRRGRRGDGSAKRRRDRKAETDEAEPETAREMPGDEDGAEPSEDGEGDEREAPEQVGAEDLREEELAARAIRRRRYKIQDVIKSRQIMLVQVVKEERGTKGAALTTYLSLAGRYCVLMPNTARGGGISRKITNAPDRKRLREIVGELEVPEGMGLIVRTAGAERTRAEIKRDYEFLLRQWEQIRELTLRSSAPCLIYEEGSLIKRSIRDIYNKDIDAVLVEGEAGYREAKDYMKMLMPSHAKNVQQYQDQIPLFIRYQVESYLNGMFSPVVQLKSGGYIVIGITEALVAIDVNSGRSTKEGSIEETATKTNLEAADEVARQLRLRDLAGLIVIDFIDMDEGRNNRAVEKRMKERLKTDRARIQVGRISAFGLMEMSRQRLRP